MPSSETLNTIFIKQSCLNVLKKKKKENKLKMIEKNHSESYNMLIS